MIPLELQWVPSNTARGRACADINDSWHQGSTPDMNCCLSSPNMQWMLLIGTWWSIQTNKMVAYPLAKKESLETWVNK